MSNALIPLCLAVELIFQAAKRRFYLSQRDLIFTVAGILRLSLQKGIDIPGRSRLEENIAFFRSLDEKDSAEKQKEKAQRRKGKGGNAIRVPPVKMCQNCNRGTRRRNRKKCSNCGSASFVPLAVATIAPDDTMIAATSAVNPLDFVNSILQNAKAKDAVAFDNTATIVKRCESCGKGTTRVKRLVCSRCGNASFLETLPVFDPTKSANVDKQVPSSKVDDAALASQNEVAPLDRPQSKSPRKGRKPPPPPKRQDVDAEGRLAYVVCRVLVSFNVYRSVGE